MPETMFWILNLNFSCGQNSESRQKIQSRKMEILIPKIFVSIFLSPLWISTLAERSGDIKIKKNVERAH